MAKLDGCGGEGETGETGERGGGKRQKFFGEEKMLRVAILEGGIHFPAPFHHPPIEGAHHHPTR